MTADISFYFNPMSRARIVRWMLEEVGEPYDAHQLDYGTTMKAPAYLAINPMGKVPAIVHDGTVVTEAAAICAYLADAFPDKDLAPDRLDPARGAYYRWLFFAAGPIEQAVSVKALDVDTSDKAMMMGFGTMDATLDAVETAVSAGDHLAGGRFSAADLYLGSQLMWGMQFGSIDKRPAFERYTARLADRPAYKRASELDDALMPKQEKAG